MIWSNGLWRVLASSRAWLCHSPGGSFGAKLAWASLSGGAEGLTDGADAAMAASGITLLGEGGAVPVPSADDSAAAGSEVVFDACAIATRGWQSSMASAPARPRAERARLAGSMASCGVPWWDRRDSGAEDVDQRSRETYLDTASISESERGAASSRIIAPGSLVRLPARNCRNCSTR